MPDSRKKKSLVDAFHISDCESCEKAIRSAGSIAMFIAGITAITAVFGFFTSSSNKALAYVLNPWVGVDAVLILVMGIFIFRKSRIASTLLVIYFVLSKAIMWHDIKPDGGWLIVNIMIFLYLVNGMRGTYIWHRSYKYE